VQIYRVVPKTKRGNLRIEIWHLDVDVLLSNKYMGHISVRLNW